MDIFFCADVAYELPTGAKIWTQDVIGYDYTIISGVITFKDNVKTGALPGGLIRNPRTQHVRDAGAVSGECTILAPLSIDCDVRLNTIDYSVS
eukprot:COSAG02_NODE_84_length_39615_cov_144.775256_28_plen_93_part_00